MAEYAIEMMERFPTEGVEKVLKETGGKDEAQRSLIERVFDVKFDNEGELTPESIKQIEDWSLHDSLERAQDSFEQIDEIDISSIFQQVLDQVNKIENFLGRTDITDGKLQKIGNSLFENDKNVKWLEQLVKKTRDKVKSGIEFVSEISFIMADARNLLNETLKFGQNKKALEEFCSKIDDRLPKHNNPPRIKNLSTCTEKSEFGGLIRLLRSKFEGLGTIGRIFMNVLCGIGMALVSAAVAITLITTILMGVLFTITAGVGCVICIIGLGYHRKVKLNSLVKGLEGIQSNLEKVNKDLESGLKTLKKSRNDEETGFSILFQAFRDFKEKIATLEKKPKFCDFHPDRIIEHIEETDSDMSVVTIEIQKRFETDQPTAWKILMFIHGCDKLESEGKLDWN